MGQKKLKRFEELNHFKNVLQYPVQMPGKWKNYFKNDNLIVLELGCGKGEYALGLGSMYPNKNFIGIDIKGNRLWKGAKTATELQLNNVAFLRIQIDKITDYFANGEVSEIWITFPDPQLRWSKMKKRLTHPKFLRLYRQIICAPYAVHLKTDSPDLFEFTLKTISDYGLTCISSSNDLHASSSLTPELAIKTHYESLDIAGSQKIHYINFLIDNELPIEKDDALKAYFKPDFIK